MLRNGALAALPCLGGLLVLLLHVNRAAAFLNIAHMVNSRSSLLWAVDQMGANAVEMDLAFADQPNAAVPIRFRHSPDRTTICDCWCYLLQEDGVPHVCTALSPNTSFDPTNDRCMVSSNATTQLNLIATKKTIAMVYIDSKIDQVGEKYSDDKLFRTGQNVYALLSNQLIKKGFKGKVLISAGTARYKEYLKGAWAAAKADRATNVYFTVDMDSYDAAYAVARELNRDGAPVMYSKGLTRCAVLSLYAEEISKAAKDRMFNETIIWTLDTLGPMADYLALGATGILTNKPFRVYTLAAYRNLFATVTKEDVAPAAPTFKASCQTLGCDCKKTSGGCVISAEAMPGCACKCDEDILGCEQEVVACNMSQPLCARPGNGVASCVFGRGDCGGYNQTCDCSFRPGGKGCQVTRAAPPNTACRCNIRGFWGCSGSLAPCSNYASQQCRSPDLSVNSCQQGGGNCGGY